MNTVNHHVHKIVTLGTHSLCVKNVDELKGLNFF